MTGSGLLEAALDYAARGWHVFPLIPGSKRPACPTHPADRCDRSDPFCRHGHTGWEARATVDPERIGRAWSSHPYGIGIACGPTRLLVLDTDVHNCGDLIPPEWRRRNITRGEDVLAELAAGRDQPKTHTVLTPSGGMHRYYLAPPSAQLGNTAGRLGWLIDTRGRGGYIVAPPTIIDGTAYSCIEDGPCTLLPAWLHELLTQPRQAAQPTTAPQIPPRTDQRSARYVTAALAGETAHVRMAIKGRRNDTLYGAAVALGQLVAAGLVDEQTVRDQLRQACAAHIASGFTAAEADATITSGLRQGAVQPRTIRPRKDVA